jgi:hypothetical protein
MEVLKLYERLTAPQEPFKPGDVIVYKPGLKNTKIPAYDQPVVVTRVLDEPIFDFEKDSSSRYFQNPLDIVIGTVAMDNDFCEFHADSRRFMKYNQR